MKILVTGGAGFIGSHIVEHFQGRAHVRVLDNLRSGFKRNLEGFDHEFLAGSITDRATVRRAMEGVDSVFHLAAMVSVPESMEKPVECNEINTAGTLVVLEEARRANVKKLVFSSSAAVYGNNPRTPKIESMLPEPRSSYAISKITGEYFCNLFSDEGWLPTMSLRYFNVFGPRQNPKSQYAAAVPIFLERALNQEPITIYGDGQQTRDFVYVKDVVAANVFFATQSSATGVCNIGYGNRISINNLAEMICRAAGSTSEIRHAAERPGDVKHSLASIDRARAAGFQPAGNLEIGLSETVEFFRHQHLVPDLQPRTA